jgi:hypothetical protein
MTRQDILDKFTTVIEKKNEPSTRIVNVAAMADRILDLESRIHKIRNLHSVEIRNFGAASWKLCTCCKDGEGLMEQYPCNTIHILDEQEEL